MQLWNRLLIEAKRENIGLFEVLTYIYKVGANLVPDDKFGFVIKPIISRNNWMSYQQWHEEKEYLKPYTEILKKILKQLRDDFDKNEACGDVDLF